MTHLHSHSGARPYRCPYENCDKAFAYGNSLKSHIRTHTGARPFACPHEDCGKRFADASTRRSHQLTHKAPGQPLVYWCRFKGCRQAFDGRSALQLHGRIHAGERPWLCPHEGCSKRLTQKRGLKAHISSHSDDKPFLCPEAGCRQTFRYRYQLRMHLTSLAYRRNPGGWPRPCSSLVAPSGPDRLQ